MLDLSLGYVFTYLLSIVLVINSKGLVGLLVPGLTTVYIVSMVGTYRRIGSTIEVRDPYTPAGISAIRPRPCFQRRHENNARTPRERLPGIPDFDSGSRPAPENVGPRPTSFSCRSLSFSAGVLENPRIAKRQGSSRGAGSCHVPWVSGFMTTIIDVKTLRGSCCDTYRDVHHHITFFARRHHHRT